MAQFKCVRCSKYYSYKKTMKQHLITCGSKHQKNIICIKCPDLRCSKIFSNKKLLKEHINIDHGVQLQEKQLRFTSMYGKYDC